MYQRIFVPVDDSATSRYALGEALRLAKLTQATVRLVHVVDLAQFGWGGTEFLDAADLQKTIKTAGEKVLQTAVSAAEEAGVPSENGLLESWGDKIAEVLVTDAEGRLTGVVSERDLFALHRVGLRQIRQAIESAEDIGSLQQSAADVRQLSFNMLAQGIGAEQLTQFISALNDALTRRVLELNLHNHHFDGVEWAWLAFGSEGRDEQTFSTDQDNGIVFTCPDAAEVKALRKRFLGPLGLFAGFVDATGGGGWGPVGTPALLASGRIEPRKVIGSIDTSEFLVAVAASGDPIT